MTSTHKPTAYPKTGTYLDKILASKVIRLAEDEATIPYSKMLSLAYHAFEANRSLSCGAFKTALTCRKDGMPALIGELKKKSPSKGLLRPDFVPAELAEAYTHAGVEALSILTEVDHFDGHPDYIRQARRATTIPLLRKDFIISSYDVLKSKVLGADALLLIAAVLTVDQLRKFIALAGELQMDCLVEIHNEEDLKKAINSGATLIGINNRDLKTFEVDLSVTERLAPMLPKNMVIVSESGILTTADLLRMKQAGVHAVLCGEVFMRQGCVATAVNKLRPIACEVLP